MRPPWDEGSSPSTSTMNNDLPKAYPAGGPDEGGWAFRIWLHFGTWGWAVLALLHEVLR